MKLRELAGNSPTSKTAVFTFGRMNPPTVGHEKLINKVINLANKYDADYFVFLSQTHKPPKNPLPWRTKVNIFRLLFPGVNVWEDPNIRTAYEAMAALGEDYSNLIFVVGGDRVEAFSPMHDYKETFDIKRFSIISAGERDPDSEGVEGMSASKAREYAKNNDFENFQKTLPRTVTKKEAKKVFQTLRQYLT